MYKYTNQEALENHLLNLKLNSDENEFIIEMSKSDLKIFNEDLNKTMLNHVILDKFIKSDYSMYRSHGITLHIKEI